MEEASRADLHGLVDHLPPEAMSPLRDLLECLGADSARAEPSACQRLDPFRVGHVLLDTGFVWDWPWAHRSPIADRDARGRWRRRPITSR